MHGEGGCLPRGCLPRRVYAQEGVCLGGVCLGGPRRCLLRGVSAWGCLADIPRGQYDRHV